MVRMASAWAALSVFVLGVGMLSGFVGPPASAVTIGWDVPQFLADGVNPMMVVDPSGNAIVAWSSRSVLWSSRFNPDLGWEPPEAIPVVDEGSLGELTDLVVDSDGNAIVLWDEWRAENPGFIRIYASRLQPTGGWGTPELVGHSRGHHNTQAAVDARGNIMVIWTYERDVNEIWANRFVPGLGWEGPRQVGQGGPVCEHCGPVFDFAMDASGNAIAVWTSSDADNNTIWANRYVPGLGWSPSEQIGSGGAPQVGIDSEGDVVVVWHAVEGCSSRRWWGPGTHQVLASRYGHAAGTGWEGPMAVLSVNIESGDACSIYGSHVTMNEDGHALLTWERGGLYAVQFVPGVGWGDVALLSKPGALSPYSHSISVNALGTAFTAWVQDKVVWASRFLPGLGWERPAAVGPSTDTSDSWIGGLQIAVAPDSNAYVLWSQSPYGPGVKALWVSRFASPSSALDELDRELRDTQDSLTESQDELRSTKMDLRSTQEALSEARGATNAALSESDRRAILMVGLQIAFAAAVVLLLSLYWNLRKGLPGTARNSRLPQRLSNSQDVRNHERTELGWPSSASTGSVHLTTKERILLHLLDSSVGEGAPEVSPAQTQSGIASSTGVDLRHFSQYIRPLMKEGFVQERVGHVQGMLQRRKVYDLTASGVRRALGIRDRVQSLVIRVKDSSGVRDATVAVALAETRGSRSILSIVRESLERGFVSLRR